MKVTKAMITRAENKHFRTETFESLQEQNALQAVYYKQQGDMKGYRYMAKYTTKKLLDKYDSPKRVVRRRKAPKKRVSMFAPTHKWGF